MADRLTSLDTSFLYMEKQPTVMHVGTVMVLDSPSSGFDPNSLLDLVQRRIAHLPRYRQRVRSIPGHLGNPVWIDDEHFDVEYHVRIAALPRPGSDEQLENFVARVQPRPLDRDRPLWEMYLVEGLQDDRFAIVTKTHYALVDGVTAMDLAALLVREEPGWETERVAQWAPRPEPNAARLVANALMEGFRTPGVFLDTLRDGARDTLARSGRLIGGVGSLASTVARGAARPAPQSPLNSSVGNTRRFIMVGTDLDDFRTVRARIAASSSREDIAVNDVVLASITGALRTWMLTRGEPVHSSTVVRALVPVSVGDTQARNQLAACIIDLPVGEARPSMRLHQIAFSMRQQIAGLGAVSVDNLVNLAGFAPANIHAAAARLGSAMSRRLFNVMITNVPGPQHTLFAGDAAMVSTYPVMPLAAGQALAIGLTSYDGGMYFGLNGDRAAMPDLDVLGQGIVDSLAELMGTYETP